MNRLFQLVQVTGGDAGSFLQGQLTQDVECLAGAGSLLGAWCNPKGRVLCVVRMLELDGGIGLVMPRELTEPIVKRLSMYRLRAKVAIDIAGPEWECTAVASDDDFAALAALDLLPGANRNSFRRAHGLIAVDTGAAPRCVEVYGTAVAREESGLQIGRALTGTEWQKALIDAGIPTIVAATSEKFTPHMLNLDLLGAVSFSKGCYTGQEIVARTQHLGSSRRRLMHYRIDGGTGAVGDKLEFEGRDAGEIVNIIAQDLLAVVAVELHGQTLTANGRPAIPIAPPYPLPPGPHDS